MFLIGEPAILFVSPESDGIESVIEMAQGHYPIRPAKDGSKRVFPSPRLSELGRLPGLRHKELIGQRVEDAIDLVRKAWRDAH